MDTLTLQVHANTAISEIKQAARERRRTPDAEMFIEIGARSSKHAAFEWTVIVGWYVASTVKCEIGTDAKLEVAVQKALDKLKPEPDISEYVGPWTPESARARVGGTLGT